MRNQAPHRFLSLIKEPQSKGQVPLIDVTLVFMQKSLGNVFDSSTKSLEDSRKVLTFANTNVK
jgi:hypothetical protein